MRKLLLAVVALGLLAGGIWLGATGAWRLHAGRSGSVTSLNDGGLAEVQGTATPAQGAGATRLRVRLRERVARRLGAPGREHRREGVEPLLGFQLVGIVCGRRLRNGGHVPLQARGSVRRARLVSA